MGNLAAKMANNNLKGTTKEAEQMCEKRRRDSLLFGEHTLTTSIRSLALGMLSDDMDAYVLKTATTEGFCYWDYVDPDAIDMPAWYDVYILIGIFHYM